MEAMYLDSTNHPIDVGNTVQFRGQPYTIKRFLPGEGSVDLIEADPLDD